MVSKLQAVKRATDAGIPTWVASGRTPGVMSEILEGRSVGTRFLVKNSNG
jgi:glutamate 5-kinase